MRGERPCRDAPHAALVAAERIESFATDARQHRKWTDAERWRGLVTLWIELRFSPAKGRDSHFRRFVMWLKLPLEMIRAGFGEEEHVFEIDGEPILCA